MQVREFSTLEDAVKLVCPDSLSIWQDGYCRISGRGILTLPCESESLAWRYAYDAVEFMLLSDAA